MSHTKPESLSPSRDSNPHCSIGDRLGKQTCVLLHHASPPKKFTSPDTDHAKPICYKIMSAKFSPLKMTCITALAWASANQQDVATYWMSFTATAKFLKKMTTTVTWMKVQIIQTDSKMQRWVVPIIVSCLKRKWFVNVWLQASWILTNKQKLHK